MNILAIDPGPDLSAYVIVDSETYRPIRFAKLVNHDMLAGLNRFVFDKAVIEKIASYGMPVGSEVFDTCIWIGRFCSVLDLRCPTELIPRQDVKLHLCHAARAKDSNIRQALVDRFTPGQPNHGKGTKLEPGWFHGFTRDVWQAYALAVYAADTNNGAPHG